MGKRSSQPKEPKSLLEMQSRQGIVWKELKVLLMGNTGKVGQGKLSQNPDQRKQSHPVKD